VIPRALLLAAALGASPQRPVLRIASDATFPPFHFVDGAGTATGYDIELARLLAESAGFEPVVLVKPYDDLLSGLETGAHDLVAATSGVTPERERIYLFTKPYFETCQAALVRAGPKEPSSLADLRGRRVGASGSGTSARALRGTEGVEAVFLGPGQPGVPSLEAGVIDALIIDEYHVVDAARASNGRLRALAEPMALERYAFVLARGRDELKASLDRAFEELERNGRVAELRIRYGVERGPSWPVDCWQGSAERR
jgi:ABC-type amino acid transport substrate-binding protein